MAKKTYELTPSDLKAIPTFPDMYEIAQAERVEIQKQIDELPHKRMTTQERRDARFLLVRASEATYRPEQTDWRNIHRNPNAGPSQGVG
jgi:hypothetical protein